MKCSEKEASMTMAALKMKTGESSWAKKTGQTMMILRQLIRLTRPPTPRLTQRRIRPLIRRPTRQITARIRLRQTPQPTIPFQEIPPRTTLPLLILPRETPPQVIPPQVIPLRVIRPRVIPRPVIPHQEIHRLVTPLRETPPQGMPLPVTLRLAIPPQVIPHQVMLHLETLQVETHLPEIVRLEIARMMMVHLEMALTTTEVTDAFLRKKRKKSTPTRTKAW
mmetsp:Transcript_24296/g.37510  ORF Transcript_24296/g.37510 Transcript_24296/m.37510 type:complete len:222 (-) Transcript_24296:2767-3432(-)